MIDDSIPWKEQLGKIAVDVGRRAGQKRWTERTGFLVERDLMIGFFAIRKLLDAPGKVSDEARAERVGVVSHPLIGKVPDFYDRYEFWEMFDLERGSVEQISVRELCNRIIHSLFFSFSGSEQPPFRLEGLFIASDFSSRKALTYIEIAEVLRVLMAFAADDVMSIQMQRGEDGVMRVVAASREVPEEVLRLSADEPDGGDW